jgi:hypothetical protein
MQAPESNRNPRRSDCDVERDGPVSVNSITLATFTVTQAGSAAGQLFAAVPPSPAYLNEDDVIVLTPSGASGASVPMHFSVAVRAA